MTRQLQTGKSTLIWNSQVKETANEKRTLPNRKKGLGVSMTLKQWVITQNIQGSCPRFFSRAMETPGIPRDSSGLWRAKKAGSLSKTRVRFCVATRARRKITSVERMIQGRWVWLKTGGPKKGSIGCMYSTFIWVWLKKPYQNGTLVNRKVD